jgi:hypothetical protein
MPRKWRCDSCKKVFSENDMIQIVDTKRRIWFRCKKCIKKWGDKPRSPDYYTYIQFEGVMGLEDPKKVISYGPRRKS